ncbi:MAG: restriction endonuclease [Balneola sp.]|nr:restriction endonuclease [Balneola sp.]|tara:strand:+ start:4469 stop:8173 length:3705 start_codon:yes stop_codon:yes gene_type:complete
MIQLQTKTVRQGINKAYLKVNVKRADLDAFKEKATAYLNNLAQAEGKDEEHHKAYLRDFLKDTFYSKEERLVNTSRNVDLGIYSGKTTSSTLEVIIEAKKPDNTREMISKDDPNAKALQEALLYYFEEREAGNEDLKQVVITNYTEFFLFDAQEIERNFYSKKALVNTFNQWKTDKKVSSNTKFMYSKFGEFIKDSDANLSAVYVDLSKFKKDLEVPASEKDDKKLIPLYKLFSPEHLVKKPFANDSNSLDKRFYNEFLHILGLQEVKEKGSRLIQRLPQKDRQSGSLIESTIDILKYGQHMSEVREATVQYGDEEDDQLFGVALELVITWMNRVLFLKLMESQLLAYHNHDPKFKFLSYDNIDEYDELNKLFFWVLALRNDERNENIQKKFGHVPYLNSSLFDATKLEHSTIRISNLDDKSLMDLYSRSVLKKGANPPEGPLNTLDYLLRFLDAYNFSAESSGGIQTEDKALINASVLGLIFEKINGYKDGSFFTPGFITEYMARETLRKSVLDKFNEAFGWDCSEFDELKRKMESVELEKANEVVNSITVCDPAVGSGHFLVSCLNELIAIKSELKILCDHEGKRIPYLDIEVENDELAIEHEGELFEYKLNHEWKNGKVIRKPAGSDRQRVQVALFHEKKFLIENCLFGVDINPNSVKICRLRLWIELLKHAYYRSDEDYSELEVLPNIDINIKQGNSLVSRFELDEDLSSIFKKSDHSLEDYKQAVRSYRETRDRSEKQHLQTLIDDIKAEYSESLINNKPINRKLSDARAKYNALVNQPDMFGKKASKKEIAKAKKKVAKLEEQKAEEEAGAFYREAFEWRFEFPEVLDEEGKYRGFDVVLGNPPYGIKFPKDLNNYLKTKFVTNTWRGESYLAFIELGQNLLKTYGKQGFIIPDTLLNLGFTNDLRNYLLNNTHLFELVLLPTNVFENATVDTILIFAEKEILEELDESDEVKVKFYSKDSIIDDLIHAEKEFFVQLKYWKELQSFNLYSDEEELRIILKLDRFQSLEKIGSVYSGIKTYEVGKGTPPQKKETRKNKPFTSDEKHSKEWSPFYDGKHIGRFTNHWNENNWIKYGEWLAAPRDPAIFEGEKILARKIVSDRLIATYIPEKSYCNTLLFIIKLESEEFTYKSLLGILNSKLIGWYYRKKFQINPEDTFPQILIRDINQFPIPEATTEYNNQIESCINQILTAKNENPESDTSKLEAEIDRLVYELYGLSEEEIGIVEGSE